LACFSQLLRTFIRASILQKIMFANLLALPFLLATLTFLYLAWTVDSEYAPYMVPFLIIGAFIFILSPQLNWWWYSRRPPQLSKGLQDILARCCTFYQTLSPIDKRKFEGRVALFRMGVNWTPIGWPDDVLPPDVELALAAQGVSLTFSREEFLYPQFEKVIIYPKPFPSPEHPYPHSSELYAPDGCLIFSAENVMRAFFNPGRFYQVGLHEYARAFMLKSSHEPWPTFEEETAWQTLEQLSGMTREHVENAVGLSGVEVLPVAIHHFFVFREQFQRAFPVQAQQLSMIFSA
jgi:hypothetical protein